ncbi:MAG TPA: MFS transporter [Nitrospiria bacterium]|nr:MFS transporter [Nitrospiria bacterium]
MPVPPVSRKEVAAWCLYDFANSAFTTIIVTVAYSVYFTQVVAEGHDPEAWWGRGYAISMILAGLMAPVLGAVSDYSKSRKFFLVGLTIACVIPTALLFFVQAGDIVLGLALFIAANLFYTGALAFYDSFLKDVSTPSSMGRISGFGWSLGYLGGLIALVLIYPLVQGGFGPENRMAYRMSFPATAVFFLLFSLPTFMFLKERGKRPEKKAGVSLWTVGFRRIGRTFSEIRRFKELVKFFVAFLIYGDGIHTVFVFAAIFATVELGFSPADLIVFFIVMQVSSGLGAFLFGFVTDRIGPKRTILITLVIWMAVIGWAYGVRTQFEFYLVGTLAGMAMGSCQSASRTLLGLFTPSGRSAEFFGFFSMTGKLAAVLGPLVYGEITGITGNQRIALLSIGGFFLVGFFVLTTVREEAGMRAVREEAEGNEGATFCS